MDGGGGQSQIAQGEDIFRKVKDLQVGRLWRRQR